MCLQSCKETTVTGIEEAIETMLENNLRHMAGPDLVDKYILITSALLVQQTGVSISIFSTDRKRTGNILGHCTFFRITKHSATWWATMSWTNKPQQTRENIMSQSSYEIMNKLICHVYAFLSYKICLLEQMSPVIDYRFQFLTGQYNMNFIKVY